MAKKPQSAAANTGRLPPFLEPEYLAGVEGVYDLDADHVAPKGQRFSARLKGKAVESSASAVTTHVSSSSTSSASQVRILVDSSRLWPSLTSLIRRGTLPWRTPTVAAFWRT